MKHDASGAAPFVHCAGRVESWACTAERLLVGVVEVDGFAKDEEVDFSGRELAEDVVAKVWLVVTRLLVLNLLVAWLPDAGLLVADLLEVRPPVTELLDDGLPETGLLAAELLVAVALDARPLDERVLAVRVPDAGLFEAVLLTAGMLLGIWPVDSLLVAELLDTELADARLFVAGLPVTMLLDIGAIVPAPLVAELLNPELLDAKLADAGLLDVRLPNAKLLEAEVPDVEVPNAGLLEAVLPDTIVTRAVVANAVLDVVFPRAAFPDAILADAVPLTNLVVLDGVLIDVGAPGIELCEAVGYLSEPGPYTEFVPDVWLPIPLLIEPVAVEQISTVL